MSAADFLVCPDCAQLTSGRCWRHGVFVTTTTGTTQIVQGGSLILEPTVAAANMSRPCDPEKVRRLQVIDYVTLENGLQTLLAEQLGIRVWFFRTGPGTAQTYFRLGGGGALTTETRWEHAYEAWVRRDHYEAIECLKTIVLGESGYSFDYSWTTFVVDDLSGAFETITEAYEGFQEQLLALSQSAIDFSAQYQLLAQQQNVRDAREAWSMDGTAPQTVSFWVSDVTANSSSSIRARDSPCGL